LGNGLTWILYILVEENELNMGCNAESACCSADIYWVLCFEFNFFLIQIWIHRAYPLSLLHRIQGFDVKQGNWEYYWLFKPFNVLINALNLSRRLLIQELIRRYVSSFLITHFQLKFYDISITKNIFFNKMKVFPFGWSLNC